MTDLHTHTIYSDGKDTPEDMILSAIEKGLDVIGISDHSYTDFDGSYCMKKDRISEYKAELNALKIKYAGRISVKCGVEQDYYSSESTDGYDYVIGSAHYVKIDEKTYIPVDLSAETLKNGAEKYFNGDIYTLCEKYYESVSDVAEKTHCDIIGHFDLVSKFIEESDLIDTDEPRYVAAWQKAADKLLLCGIPFEINTGAITRGYRTTPYPSESMREYLSDRGARFVYSSDAHSKENIAYGNPGKTQPVT